MDTPCQRNSLEVEDNTAISCKDNDSLFGSKESYPLIRSNKINHKCNIHAHCLKSRDPG